MFRRLLVACEGEAAARVIRTCRRLRIATVALTTRSQASPAYLEEADARACVARTAGGALSREDVLSAARAFRCGAIHPGWDDLAQDPVFARRCELAGLALVGPAAHVIRALLDPVSLWRSLDQTGLDPLPPAHQVPHGRRLALEVAADRYGRHACLGLRDGSIGWAPWRFVEETPPPNLPTWIQGGVGERVGGALAEAGLVGFATLDLLLAPEGRLHLLGGTPGLQAGHPSTEAVTGMDLVEAQLALATGHRLPPLPRPEPLHVVALHILAADPHRDLAPTDGSLRYLKLPVGHGVRVDTHLKRTDPITGTAGDPAGGEATPTLCKVIVTAPDRCKALEKASDALRQTRIQGLATNLPLLQPIVDHPTFRAGPVNASFVEQNLADLLPPDLSSPPAEPFDTSEWAFA